MKGISVGPAAPQVVRTFARRLTAIVTAAATALAALVVAPAPVSQAQSGSIAIVRDAEIESLLREYANPIFRAAGVSESATEIILVNNRSFNAFVANGRRIFINVGAIMDSETPNELIGVIAHETGHIAGGHLARLRQEVANAQVLSVVSMLLGAGAMAGAGRGNIGDPGL
jgi:predicted Zn-dependent protease